MVFICFIYILQIASDKKERKKTKKTKTKTKRQKSDNGIHLFWHIAANKKGIKRQRQRQKKDKKTKAKTKKGQKDEKDKDKKRENGIHFFHLPPAYRCRQKKTKKTKTKEDKKTKKRQWYLFVSATSCISLPMIAISTIIQRRKFGTYISFF